MDNYRDYGLRSWNQGHKIFQCRATGSETVEGERTGVGFDFWHSDIKLIDSVGRWNLVNVRLNRGYANSILGCHFFNGAGGKPFTVEESINIEILAGGSHHINDCYIDKGKIVIKYSDTRDDQLNASGDDKYNLYPDAKLQFVGNHYLFANNSTGNNREVHSSIFVLENNCDQNGSRARLDFPQNIVWGPATYPEFTSSTVGDYTKHSFLDLRNAGSQWSTGAADIELDLLSNKIALNTIQENTWGEYDLYRVRVNDKIRPGTNLQIDLGESTYRWKEVFCQSVNQSSDERLKSDIVDLDQAEINVAKAVRKLVKRYKFNGEDKHSVGIIAQQLISAFQAEGLDPFDYNVISDDGNYYGVDYSQLLCFIIGGLD